MNSLTPANSSAFYFTFDHEQSKWIFAKDNWMESTFATTIVLFGIGYVFYRRIWSKSATTTIPVINSSLPWIGSALDFVRAPTNFLRECRQQYGSAYRIHATGRTILVITSPKAILTMLSHKATDFEIVDYLNLHVISGIDTARMPKIWPAILDFFKASHALFNPAHSQPLVYAYNNIVAQNFLRITADENHSAQSLDDFVFRINHFAVYGMFMGTQFNTKPKTYNSWRAYDSGVHNIIRRLPFLSRGAIRGREDVLETVSEYVRQNWVDSDDGGYIHGASEIMSVVAQKLKDSPATEEEIARVINYLLWGTAGNIARLINWVMRYIIVYSDVYASIQEEIRQVMAKKYLQADQLTQLDPRTLGADFPLLSSTVNEVIRLLTQTVLLRRASVDTVLLEDDGRVIPISKGDYILADTQGYHHSEDYFDDAYRFKPDRYTQEQAPSRSLAFSAGPHICSGEFLAKTTTRMFVVLCLAMYDVEVKFEKGVTSALEILPNSFLQLPLPKYEADITLRRRVAS
ncbi:Prostacyclin synthase [Psilocybe cubensis]|uniref:Prostacyclin synthase n=2 Tax=Psilocybe cubensis TaxID=181762 RepID=A0ACB8GST4_PSICU|nr:Prostacyclin synthase [Psilocybe cubensis]KAH9478636.1 Prostacyclin synthase [Psilocybe cubensis]